MAKKPKNRAKQGGAKKAAKKRTDQRPAGTLTARRRRDSPTTKPRGAKLVRVARVAAADSTIDVTMKIDFGAGAPSDIQSVRRIDTTDLSGPGASISSGKHTVGWDVSSPTVRPIGFAVTIVRNETGKKVFDRPGQKTGADGKGAGAGTFTV